MLVACVSPRPALPPGAADATRGVQPGAADDTSAHRQTQAAQDLWAILDPCVNATDGSKSVQAFHDRLLKLPPDELRKIDREFGRELASSYSWELWGAAYIINGGCSDDCFDYFRGWLIMQGSAIFHSAVRDPDSLADYAHLSNDAELEDAISVTRDAYQGMTGKEPAGDVANPELGAHWDFDDHAEMRRRYPKLSRKFKW